MDSYDKFLIDMGKFPINYRDVKLEDQDGVNDYINLSLWNEEYINSIDVYTDIWLSLVKDCRESPCCSYDSCVVNGNKYYIMIGSGD